MPENSCSLGISGCGSPQTGRAEGRASCGRACASAGDANQKRGAACLARVRRRGPRPRALEQQPAPRGRCRGLLQGSIPVVANGKVYLGSLSNAVSVYGCAASGIPEPTTLALNKPGPERSCSPTEIPAHAVNAAFARTATSFARTVPRSPGRLGWFMVVDDSSCATPVPARRMGLSIRRDFTISVQRRWSCVRALGDGPWERHDVTVHDVSPRAPASSARVRRPPRSATSRPASYSSKVYVHAADARPRPTRAFCARTGRTAGA